MVYYLWCQVFKYYNINLFLICCVSTIYFTFIFTCELATHQSKTCISTCGWYGMYHTHRISSINTGSLISTIVRYYLSTNNIKIMLILILILIVAHPWIMSHVIANLWIGAGRLCIFLLIMLCCSAQNLTCYAQNYAHFISFVDLLWTYACKLFCYG